MSSIYQAEIDELDEGENNIHVSYSDIFENYTPTSGSEYAVEIVAYVEQGTNLDSANGSLEIVDTTPVSPTIELTATNASIDLNDATSHEYTFEAACQNLNENCAINYSIDKTGGHVVDNNITTLSEGSNNYTIDLASIIMIQSPSAGAEWTITLTAKEGDSTLDTATATITFTDSNAQLSVNPDSRSIKKTAKKSTK